MDKLVFATNNPGKVRELTELLRHEHIELIPQAALGVEDIEETGLTFIENALLKARHASRVTGLPAIADDSGLAVNALGGAPGIYSARYAGEGANAESNIRKLLTELKSTPDNQRQASFHCVLVYLSHEYDPTPLVCDGIWHGTILREPRGTTGFGYDPVFYVPDEKKSAAELEPSLKNKISHRGKALKALLAAWAEKT